MERATNRSRREEVQKIILALLVCQKNAIAITSLEKEYMEQEGERVPWRSLGHVSFLDFLQSMPDLLIEWRNNEYFARSVPTKKSAHVSSLVARQRISSKKVVGIRKIRPSHYYPKTDEPKVRLSAERLSSVVKLVKQNPKGISKDYLLMTINKEYPYVNICLQDFEDQLRQLSHKVTMQDNLVFPVMNDEDESQDVKPNLAQQSNDVNQRCTPPCKYYMSDGEDYSDDYDSDDNVFSKFTQYKSQSRAIPSMDNKITSGFLQEGTAKDLRELDNHTDSCNSYRVECGSAKNNFSYDDVRENDNDSVNCLGDGNMQILVNDRVKFRLEKLIQKYPNGIWCAELPQKYLEEYNMDLKYTELGFNSVREFASHLRDIFHCMRPWPNSDYILYNAKDEAPDSSKKQENSTALAELHDMQFEDDIEAMPAIVSLDTSKKLIPESVMTIGEMVSQLSVESLINGTKLFVEVYVVEVFTPSFFWIQLRKNKKSFVQFMTELHEFYTDQYKHYTIPPVVLEKGLNCACIYEGVWHRGIIKSVKPDLQVTVLFYDYGTLKTYPASSIYYLDRKFSFLPAQAIPCGLINTRPINGTEWSQSITHKFAAKTYQIPLIATIGSVDVENNSMMVTLTNTLEDEDVHINDWLVEQNLAVHGTMGDCVDTSKLFMYEEENLMYQLDQFDNVIDTVDNETRSTENAPLISPQKTLIDKSLLPLPKLLQSDDESSRLAIIPEESSHKSADIDRNDARNAQFASKQRSNPFLYNEQLYDIYANVLPVQSIIRMWRSNLELQIPIIKYYNNHLSRVSARTKNVPKEMIAWVEGATNNLITALNALEHIVSNIDNIHSTTASAFDNSDKMYSVSTFNNYGKHVHAFNTLSSSMNTFSTGEFYGPMQNTAHNCHRTQPDLTDTGHISQNPFDDTRHGQAPFLKANIRLNGTVLSPYDNWPNDTCSFNNNDLGLSDIAMRVQALAVDANIHDANHDNSDINGGIDFSESTSVESTPVRKETNPFRIGFTVGDTASLNETQRRAVPAPIASPKKSRTVKRLESNCSQQETRGNISDVPRYELFAGKREVNLNENECPARVDPYNIFPFDNKPSKSKRSLFGATEEPADDNRNVSRSYFSCDDPSSLLGIRQSPNTNVPIVSQTPFTASTLPLSTDNLNCDDEGYLTRPPTSDTLGSSPPLGLINEVESSERPLTTDASQPCSISAEAWIKAIESAIAMNSPSSKRCDDALTSNIAECVNSENIPLKFGNPANSFNFAHTGANGHSGNLIELTNSVCKDSNDEDEQKKQTKLNIKEEINESNAYLEDRSLTISSTEQLFFQSVELTNGPMYVFHFEENGWLSIDEFTETFTEFRTPSSMMAMKNMDVELSLKELNRQDYPSAFAELDSSSLRASRDSEHRICKISMISLRSGLKVLVSLKVIDPKDYNEGKFEKGSPLYEIKTLTSAYKDLKRRLKENQS